MSWVKLTDIFPEDPKITELSHQAFRLHITALCYCARNLTDGHVSTKALKASAATAGVAAKAAMDLMEAGLWEPNGDGYVIRNYLTYNPSSTEVKTKREAARERMRRLRGDH